MNDGLRWLLVLGCLSIVFLEAPQDLLQILQDSSGAYPAPTPSAIREAPLAKPISIQRRTAEDLAPFNDVVAGPSVVFTKLDSQGEGSPSPALARGIRNHRESEENVAHDPRNDAAERHAKFAGDR
jgi:hypothetical protein